MSALPGSGSHRSGVATNGQVELAFRVDGGADGRHRLVLVNGLGSPMVAFEDGFVAALVARGCVVVRFDNRDVGWSTRFADHPPAAGPAYHLADLAADTVAVLDAVDWERAHVVGQSMGGMIAQQVAIDHPSRVASLTSMMSSTGARGHGRSTPEAGRALLEPPPADRAGWLDHRVRTERVWASPAHWDEAAVRAKGAALFDHGVDPAGASRQFRAVATAGSRDDQLALLDVPTLVLHGDADTLVAPDAGRHTAEVIPGAHYVEIAGWGHDLPQSLWDRVAAEIMAFVAPVDGDLP